MAKGIYGLLPAALGAAALAMAAVAMLLEFSLDGFLLSVGELAILVGVKLLHESGLHLGLLLLGQFRARTLRAAALTMMTRALAAALAMAAVAVLLELSLDGFLLSVGELAILIGVKLLHESGLHLSLTYLAGSLAFIAGKLAVLIGIKLGQHFSLAGFELSLHLGLLLLGQLRTGAAGTAATRLLGSAFCLGRAFLSHKRHGSQQGEKEGFFHDDMVFLWFE